jgi:S1-C subfamily serine protease
VLTAVERGSAAARAGLRSGDRILEFAGSSIDSGESFSAAVLTAASPATIRVARDGNEDPLDVLVELEGSPLRVGISWREDEAEPGTVILTRVVPASAAHQAGLRAGDRVYAVGGELFADSEAFNELVTTLPGPLEVTVERRGRLSAAVLELPPPVETPAL